MDSSGQEAEPSNNTATHTTIRNGIIVAAKEMPGKEFVNQTDCTRQVTGEQHLGKKKAVEPVIDNADSTDCSEFNRVSILEEGLQQTQIGVSVSDKCGVKDNDVSVVENEQDKSASEDSHANGNKCNGNKNIDSIDVEVNTRIDRNIRLFSDVITDDGFGVDKKGIDGLSYKEPDRKFDMNERWRIMRNLIMLGFSYFVLFTAFKGAGNLQSSINMEGGLGTSSLMAYYGAFVVSSIFLPVVMIQRMGCKWTIAVSAVLYAPFIAAQFYPEFSTLIPGAISAGVGAGPIWCAMCTYTMVIADVYARIIDSTTEAVTTKFYGIFYMIYQLSQVSGNLISSLVISPEPASLNVTLIKEDHEPEERAMCGATFCPGVQAAVNPNLARPPEYQIDMLSWIYLACVLLATLLIAITIDSLSRYEGLVRHSAAKESGLDLLAVTVKLLKHPYQLLLMPVTIFFGMEKAFLGAEYTAVYVSCAVGIHHIGYTMIGYGVTNSASSFVTSALVRLIGRRLVMAITTVLHIVVVIILLVWAPGFDDASLLYVLAAIWGVLDGVWLVQLNTLTGLLFAGNEEAAYSNYHLWESIGYIACYGCSNLLCTDVKLYTILVFLVVGAAGYAAIEWSEARRKDKE